MPIPVSYTEKSLAEYMYRALGKVSKVLNIHLGTEDAGDLSEVVNDTLLAYGTDSISSISGRENILKLRSLALVAMWRYVIANFTALYDFSADGASYQRNQMFKSAQEALKLVEQQALLYSSAYSIKIISAKYVDDPYIIPSSNDEMAGD